MATAPLSAPRIAYIDIETAPILANVWTLHEANAIWVERDTYILCFAVMWDGFKSVKTFALPDYKTYQKDKHNDRELVGDLWNVLEAADVIIGHNADSFDLKKIRARFAVHGRKPPSPFKTIDTLKIARRNFKFDSNKLDNLGRYLGCGRKLQHTGAHLWRSCIEGNAKAWGLMTRYCAQDVRLLERVYQQLKPWANGLDLRVFHGAHGCPTCLSPKIQRRGVSIARTRRYQRYHCQSCGHWFSGELLK
jgi:DNA polymerase elongation subunit (family B)